MENKIKLANEQIKRVVEFLQENENAFLSMNLKLHSASYYTYSEMEKDFPLCHAISNKGDYFNDFCDVSYLFFKEDLKIEKGIFFDDMYHQLGRTSSFYLHDCNVIEINRNEIDFDYTISNLIDKLYEPIFVEVENCNVETIEEEEEEGTKLELDYIINNFYNDVVEYCTDILYVYEAITNFKENQIEYFKEYLQGEEENLIEQKEEQERIENEKVKTIEEIQVKYSISDDDMKTLKENL